MFRLLVLATILAHPAAADEPSPSAPQRLYDALAKKFGDPPSDYIRDEAKAQAASRPFLELARENPTDPAALMALHWVVTHTLYTPAAGEAMDALSRSHQDDPRLATVIKELDRLYGGPFDPLEQLLRATLRSSGDRRVRGWACLALGRYLGERRRSILKDRQLHADFLAGKNTPFAQQPKETDADLAELARESDQLLLRAKTEFGDIDGLRQELEKDHHRTQPAAKK